MNIRRLYHLLLTAVLLPVLSGCLPEQTSVLSSIPLLTPSPVVEAAANLQTSVPDVMAFPTRPPYQPGELVEYTAQTGDTLPALAARFNTTIQEIRTANPIIPDSATTMPPGMPMKIPIYYRPLWGNPYQIIPDSLYINGPAQVGFNAVAFVDQQPGWLKLETEYVGDRNRRGGEIVNYIASEYSVSPRLLLAISEYQMGALTNPKAPDSSNKLLFGRDPELAVDYYHQLAWLADTLNNGYYNWRTGDLLELQLSDGRIERPDPWQNAATVTLQNYFNIILTAQDYERAISQEGLAKTYRTLFGDPWKNVSPHLPASLEQPRFIFPFEPGKVWAFTGGPHSAWGEGATPLAAIDFAPPSTAHGCATSGEWVTAMADGVVVRTGTGILVLDLDGDGDERTGWEIFYLHLETASIPPVGTRFKTGDRIGHPSCDGGHATGTHVHIARKFNGEWILADSMIPFNLEGWIAHYSGEPYMGTLTLNGKIVVACTCSDSGSFVQTRGVAATSP